ncbi:MAG: excinuclease ABC subunit A, partial [Sphingobacteriaceae bacterium]
MEEFIKVRGAKEHNLKNINIDIPKNKLVVITGLSGSGKSSLAFDTIYAEGQRRYVESLSAYARQFLQLQDKPNVESIDGLSPAIAIDQKTTSKNPRSTVGTITEIYDYLRLLFARVGVPYSPATGLPIQSQSSSQITEAIASLPDDTKLYILAPIIRGAKGEHKREIINAKSRGYQRVKIDGKIYDIDDLPKIEKTKKHDIDIVIDRLVISDDIRNRIADSVETALILGEGIIYIDIIDDNINEYNIIESLTFSEKFSCPISGFQITEIEPRIFSFNSPFGACPACEGLGTELYFDSDLVISNPNLSIRGGAITPWSKNMSKYQQQAFESLAKHYKFSLDTAFCDLPNALQEIILYGSKQEEITMYYSDSNRKQTVTKAWDGIISILEKRLQTADANHIRDELEKFQTKRKCKSCNGYRLKSEVLCIKIDQKHIGEISALTIAHALEWIINLPQKLDSVQNKIAERVIKEIKERIGFLNNVGLDYLTLSRESGTLSGGESQRIRLASQIGSGLSGVLYVLDEPSIGLHQCDNDRLITTLKNLRDLGNTVIVVEHDEETMMEADHLIDIGPGAGVYGGEIISFGTPEEVKSDKNSVTGQYLDGSKFIP